MAIMKAMQCWIILYYLLYLIAEPGEPGNLKSIPN